MSQSENRITVKKILEFSLLFNDCVYVMYSVLPHTNLTTKLNICFKSHLLIFIKTGGINRELLFKPTSCL